MKKALVLGIVVLALAIGAFVGGSWWTSRKSAVAVATQGRKVLYYVDPMNPAHTSDKPGLAPCGMKMEPVYADQAGVALPAGGPLLPGSVKVSAERQQLIGVRVGVVEKRPLQRTVRLLGRVAADETRVYRMLATVDGWVTKALPFATGSPVKKDETLATFYSPEFLAAGQALLFALNSRDRAQMPGMDEQATNSRVSQFNVNIQQYRDSLRNLGMSDLQIDEMIRTRKFTQSINLVAPADGFVAARSLSDGQRFQKGTELFRIVDLGRVWILADVFEKDARVVRPGASVRVSLPNQGKALAATMSQALPQFDATTRTLKLRLEAENPDFSLKPEMFVDLELSATLPEALVVPADAVLDAGLRQTVFVDRGNGYFEPRVVRTGERAGDEVQILQGLMAGERIVVSGNFLLDSESRMKLAAAGVYGAPTQDPVCGMAVDEAKARAANRAVEHGGKTYFFCNDGCKVEFTANPGKYLKSGGGPASAHGDPDATPDALTGPSGTLSPSGGEGRGEGASSTNKAGSSSPAASQVVNKDPVCGMVVNEQKARAAGRTYDYGGKTYLFCCDGCKEEFAADPKKFLKDQTESATAPLGHEPPPNPLTPSLSPSEGERVPGGRVRGSVGSSAREESLQRTPSTNKAAAQPSPSAPPRDPSHH
jgi:RND family efflux transporter MFP subunit